MEKIESATVGGGCFWCLEAVYQNLDGVREVKSGYAGGHVVNPTYREVCAGTTGHAEVVQVKYDPELIGFEEILDWFWRCHDPTTLNRQGADVGSQYRSVILTHDPNQAEIATRSKDVAAKHFKDPIVTEIQPLERFYPAEDYHHNYYRDNPDAPYCTFVIRPKLAKLNME